jgi:transaldolase
VKGIEMEKQTYKSPLHQMVMTTATDYWNDSCSLEELAYAIERGAVGATSNPQIVLGVLKKEMHLWRDRIHQIIRENPTWHEDHIAWKVIEELAVKGAEQLYPVFEREGGKKGRLSLQTNPAFYRDADAIVQQAVHFDSLAPNIQVKAPVTKAGVAAIEEATYHGVNINATVCFSVPQALAVAEAVECGLNRRAAEGKDISKMSPVCTIMIGRLDDWIKVLEKRDHILLTPGYSDWAGIAAMKRAYEIYQQRGYRTRLLAAAYRHHMHWSELIGGDIVMTITYDWQKLYNESDMEVKEHFDNPVPPEIIETLYQKFPDFRRAYDPDGMSVEAFDSFGPTVRTLRTFIGAYHDLIALIREFMLPNPDVK